MQSLEFDFETVYSFVREHIEGGVARVEGMRAIGLRRDGELVAGVVYEGYNGRNIWMHVAAIPGARWMSREFLHAVFAYPFDLCKVDRVSGYVNESNLQARRFDEHLGFKEEARLRGAAPDGGDVLVYVMWRDDCRFLRNT